jgi:hypothetical protein
MRTYGVGDRSSARPAGALQGDVDGHGAPVPPRSPAVADDVGLHLPHRLSFDRWLTMGQQLSAIATSSAWCLGDWVVYGQDTYTGRYRAAIERTSLDYQTLRNYAWVVRRFPHHRRRAELSFGHHAEVAALSEPEQDFWLGKATKLGWSRNRLRRQVRDSLDQRAGADDADFDGSRDSAPSPISLVLTQDQLDMCERAANSMGIPFNEWILAALEQAALHQLTTVTM